VPALNPALVISEASESRTFLDRAQGGDCEAFGEVCRLYETRLLRQAMTLCRNESMAEELAQDTLVEAWKSLRRYNGECQFFTWLCAILLNRYRNTVRRKRPLSLSSLARRDEDEFVDRLERLPNENSLPDEAAQHADTIFLGPGEDTWPQFLRDFRNREGKKRYQSQQRSLLDLPPVRRDLIKRHLYLVPNSIVVSRGCPYVCDFCYKVLCGNCQIAPFPRLGETPHHECVAIR